MPEENINRTGLHFNCDKCGHPINQPAALLFSPPLDDDEFKVKLPDQRSGHSASILVKKYHICNECYKEVVKEFLK
ncbi:hypothetical protein BMS3Bbin06_01668 [bacterium BMS3Bbin06]|nr:hypothetical protein BMS3Bbin06_01668 [bacterium BMS3Bbin06]